ncbi:glutaredoxin domain-containing protein [Cyclospora cayetanensis]|uniref:Glutaredoxin domain-containing protein n=1 Tax=Cyclospora cayetanensis TaxID=88456 RepID=A0A1D3D790_9EIME|nr:glutaredoxin domain-containing protein [Cyclospora cayetanensis]
MAELEGPGAYSAFCGERGPKAVFFVSRGDAPSEQLLQLLPTLQQDFPAVALGHMDVSKASTCLLANAGVSRHPTINFLWDVQQIGQLVGSDVPCLGKREAPFCRFSKAVLALLEEQGVKNFGTFDVFEDPSVREGLKKFSDWPTYPQLYANVSYSSYRLLMFFICASAHFDKPPHVTGGGEGAKEGRRGGRASGNVALVNSPEDFNGCPLFVAVLDWRRDVAAFMKRSIGHL